MEENAACTARLPLASREPAALRTQLPAPRHFACARSWSEAAAVQGAASAARHVEWVPATCCTASREAALAGVRATGPSGLPRRRWSGPALRPCLRAGNEAQLVWGLPSNCGSAAAGQQPSVGGVGCGTERCIGRRPSPACSWQQGCAETSRLAGAARHAPTIHDLSPRAAATACRHSGGGSQQPGLQQLISPTRLPSAHLSIARAAGPSGRRSEPAAIWRGGWGPGSAWCAACGVG